LKKVETSSILTVDDSFLDADYVPPGEKKKFKESSFDIISLPNNEAVNLVDNLCDTGNILFFFFI